MKKSKELLQAAAAAARKAQELHADASKNGRQLTTADHEAIDAEASKARQLYAEAQEAKAAEQRDEDLLAQMKQIGDLFTGQAAEDAAATILGKGGDLPRPGKSLGELFVESKQYKDAINSVANCDEFGALTIPNQAKISSAPVFMKSLFTGASTTSAGAFVVPDRTDIVEMLGRRPLTIRDVISIRRTSSDTVDYVKQTSHTNAAAPVAEATTSAAPTTGASSGAALVKATGGGYKPEGAWAFQKVQATVKTIAEWVPATKRSIADMAQLEGLINDELRADLAEAEENQIVNGNGTGENLTGITQTSGTQAQTFVTDIFTTLRKALTKVKTTGRTMPNAIGLNPTDVETIDLARENGTTGAFLGAGPFAMGPRTVWGVPVLESEAFTAGTAVVGDFRKAVLWDREQASISMTDSHEDFFVRNLVAILGEERVAFAVTRPAAFCLAALA